MGRRYHLRMNTLETTAPLYQSGSKKSRMKEEENGCTVPLLVASAPGELVELETMEHNG